jgi:DNA-binding NarL/FixJ family response regulator
VITLLQSDFEIVATVTDGRAAVEVANKLVPDVLVLDVSMPILSGIDVAKRLKKQGCEAKILFLSVFLDLDQVTACLAAGGDGYVSKIQMGTDLVHAVKEVLAGRSFVSPPIS